MGATVAVVKSFLDGRAPLSWVDSESGWGSIVRWSGQEGKSRSGLESPHARARACEIPTGKTIFLTRYTPSTFWERRRRFRSRSG
jgi:hypothetical protein